MKVRVLLGSERVQSDGADARVGTPGGVNRLADQCTQDSG